MLLEPIKFVFNDQEYFMLFEGNSSIIIQIDEFIFSNIDDIIKLTYTKFIEKYNKKLPLKEIKTFYEDLESFEKEISKKNKRTKLLEECKSEITPTHMVFSITNNCNFKCSYCYDTGKYATDSNRKGSMELSVLYRTLDWLHDINPNCSISFYGGEPLLEFEKIQRAIQYCKKRNYTFNNFTITTNGSLLKDQILTFLVKNNFNLSISYDGNKEIHNKYRKQNNGNYTFDLVKKNIESIRSHFPKYYKTKVTLLSTVYSIKEYFLAGKEIERDFPGIYHRTSLVAPKDERSFLNGMIEMEELSKNTDYEFYKNITKMKREFEDFTINLENYMNNQNFRLESSSPDFFKKIRYLKLIVNRNNNFNFLRGTCNPIGKRPAVDVKGNLYPCEKMLANNLIIGNYIEKYNHNKIKNIMLNYKQFRIKYCKECWAKNLCTLCMNTFLYNKNDDFKSNIGQCEIEKNYLKNCIGVYSYLVIKFGEVKVNMLVNKI
jgi:uncharacterized protein